MPARVVDEDADLAGLVGGACIVHDPCLNLVPTVGLSRGVPGVGVGWEVHHRLELVVDEEAHIGILEIASEAY